MQRKLRINLPQLSVTVVIRVLIQSRGLLVTLTRAWRLAAKILLWFRVLFIGERDKTVYRWQNAVMLVWWDTLDVSWVPFVLLCNVMKKDMSAFPVLAPFLIPTLFISINSAKTSPLNGAGAFWWRQRHVTLIPVALCKLLRSFCHSVASLNLPSVCLVLWVCFIWTGTEVSSAWGVSFVNRHLS